MTQPAPLTATIRIAASPQEVFPYLVEPSLLLQWIGSWADLSPEPGGAFAVDIGGTPVRGSFVAVEPPDRVVFTWGMAGSDILPAGSTTVEILLKADGEETIVDLIHYDLPADQRPGHQSGWDSYLTRLRHVARSARSVPDEAS